VTEKRQKTIVVPDDFTAKTEPVEPMIAFIGWDDDPDERDVSKPVALDAHGQPLYAPRGRHLRRII
jgi:hypothetical protein